MTRVAAIIDATTVSGPGRQLAALAGALGARQVVPRVITFQRAGRARPPLAAHLERAGIDVLVLPDDGPADLRLVHRLRAALDEWGPDVVQTHGYRPTALAYMLRRTGSAWPWAAFFHGSTAENLKVRLYNWLDRRLLPMADALVVMSERDRARFARLGHRVRVIHNAALSHESEQDDRAAAAVLAPLSGARPLVAVIGRLSPEKGVDVFLHAAALLAARGAAFTGVVVGDGPERARLESLRAALGLDERVRFVGALASAQGVYRHVDLVAIPSRSEGLPNVLLEAVRADVPVVSTAVGAVPEVLGDTPAGRVVPPENPAALAAAMEHVLTHGRAEAARAARREITERFSLARRVAEHLRLYDELRRVRRAPAPFASRRGRRRAP